jgi:hypothetical protein
LKLARSIDAGLSVVCHVNCPLIREEERARQRSKVDAETSINPFVSLLPAPTADRVHMRSRTRAIDRKRERGWLCDRSGV